jgi:hypothetical protein
MELLEPRLLFSADGLDLTPAIQAGLDEPLSVVLIDASLDEAQMLCEAVDSDAHAIVYDGSMTGEQLLERLSGVVESRGRAIDTLGVLSHGSAGSFSFVGGSVDAASLSGQQGAFWAQVSEYLQEDANLGLYACNLVEDAGLGASLVEQLAQVTGADVFASDDLTGAGGDWVLEVASEGAVDELGGLDFGLDAAWLEEYEHTLAQTVSGTVYEDVDGDGAVSDDGQAAAGVTVHLYQDGGDGTMDAGDALLLTTTTDASGQYSFAGLADGTYWVAIDSKTIAPSGGFNAGYDQGDVWAEQTYGSTGAVFLNGGYDYLSAAGSLHGGLSVDTSDDASLLLTSEHVTRAVVSGADVTGLDSGFSFQAITTTRDGDDDGGAARSVQGSLRQFIQNSNAIVGTQTSRFALSDAGAGHVYYQDDGLGDSLTNIVATTQSDAQIADFDSDYVSGGFSWWRFQPTNELPGMVDTVNLDGTTQQGWSVGRPVVEIDGVNLGDWKDVITVSAAGSEIRGLAIHNSGDAIQLVNADDVTIAGNFIGTDITGTQSGGGNGEGIDIEGSCNVVVGGENPADRNLISAMAKDGIEADTTSTGLLVQNNFIGTDVTGTADLGNANSGVIIKGAGGQVLDNVISGNADHGISFGQGADGFVVQGNLIGTDLTGTVLIENDDNDVNLNKVDNGLIGGYDVSQRNIISVGTVGIGIKGFSSVDNIRVLNNYIGLDITGQNTFCNHDDGTGINVQGGTGWQIGDVGAGNVISGMAIAVHFHGSATYDNTVQSNLLGTDAGGDDVFGFRLWGVWFGFDAHDNLVGGIGAGEGNLIAGADHDGVSYNTSDSTLGNRVLGNTIYATGMFPIDLDSDTYLANDADESDGWQNHPTLNSAMRDADGRTTVLGSLRSTAHTTFRVELFSGSDVNAYGLASGRVFLGYVDVTTNAQGVGSFSFSTSRVSAGQYISATATDTGTSEFSMPVTVVAQPQQEEELLISPEMESSQEEPETTQTQESDQTQEAVEESPETQTQEETQESSSDTQATQATLDSEAEADTLSDDASEPQEEALEESLEPEAQARAEGEGAGDGETFDALAQPEEMEERDRKDRRASNPAAYAHAEVDLDVEAGANGLAAARHGRIHMPGPGAGAEVVYMNLTGLDGLAPGQIVSPKSYGTLHEAGQMWRGMRRSQETTEHALAGQARMKDITVGAVVGVSAIASMGYLVWSIKSGALLSSFVAALPSWRVFDPLPVLDFADKKRKDGSHKKQRRADRDADVVALTRE